MDAVNLSWIPPVSKKTVIAFFLATGCLFISLIAATAMGILSYGEVKYLHWMISLSLPLWVLLMANPNTQYLNIKFGKKVKVVLVFIFAVFVITFLAAMLTF